MNQPKPHNLAGADRAALGAYASAMTHSRLTIPRFSSQHS